MADGGTDRWFYVPLVLAGYVPITVGVVLGHRLAPGDDLRARLGVFGAAALAGVVVQLARLALRRRVPAAERVPPGS